MSPQFGQLPLRSLVVFEAAARLGSFTAAAAALAMTQAAVSQHVARLEAELGIALFVRRHRGVGLTDAGTTCLATVAQGLQALADAVATAQRRGARRSLQILTDYGFASAWLMPRIAAFSALLPGVEIRVATTSFDLDRTDAEFDVAVMFGDGMWPDWRSTPLFAEIVEPVAAPALVDRGTLLSAAEIAALPLIHLRGAAAERSLGWDDWFAANAHRRVPNASDIIVDNYQLALEAAVAGRGACLGWTPLADAALADGRLARLSGSTLTGPCGYHIVEHPDRPRSANLDMLKAWLMEFRPAEIPATPLQGERHERARSPVS